MGYVRGVDRPRDYERMEVMDIQIYKHGRRTTAGDVEFKNEHGIVMRGAQTYAVCDWGPLMLEMHLEVGYEVHIGLGCIWSNSAAGPIDRVALYTAYEKLHMLLSITGIRVV